MPLKPNRCWFQFSLRTLFVVVTLLCLWLGWSVTTVLERRNLRARYDIFFTEAVDLGPLDRSKLPASPRCKKRAFATEGIHVPLARRILGDSPSGDIFVFDEPSFAAVVKAFPESLVELCEPPTNVVLSRDAPPKPIPPDAQDVLRHDGDVGIDQQTLLDGAARLRNQAEALFEIGRAAEALSPAEQSLVICDRLADQEHPETGRTLFVLAAIEQQLGRYSESESHFQRSLTILEKSMGPEHPAVGMCLELMGVNKSAEGDYTGAEELFKRALAIQEKTQGPDSESALASLMGLGRNYVLQKKYATAKPLLLRALHLQEETLGHDAFEVSNTLHALADMYVGEGKFGEAEPLAKRALRIQEQRLGPNHGTLAPLLTLLGSIYAKEGKTADADKLFTRATAIRKRSTAK